MPRTDDRLDYPLTLRQADQSRADLAAIERDLQFVMGQLARPPTRAYFCKTSPIATASVWALIATVAMLLAR
jgi:hypothetical protein